MGASIFGFRICRLQWHKCITVQAQLLGPFKIFKEEACPTSTLRDLLRHFPHNIKRNWYVLGVPNVFLLGASLVVSPVRLCSGLQLKGPRRETLAKNSKLHKYGLYDLYDLICDSIIFWLQAWSFVYKHLTHTKSIKKQPDLLASCFTCETVPPTGALDFACPTTSPWRADDWGSPLRKTKPALAAFAECL